MKIDVHKLVKGKKTYPSWATNASHILRTENRDKELLVYYLTKSNRRISRIFPNQLDLTPSFIYALGLLKGEGSNSLGKSNYRRLTITNNDYHLINLILEELEKSNLFKRSDLIDKSLHLLHHQDSDKKVIEYWSKCLHLPKKKFKCFNDERKTTPSGTCHVYISDVLLRRILDLVHDEFFNFPKPL